MLLQSHQLMPGLAPAGVHPVWVADIRENGIVHLLIDGVGEIQINAPLRPGETVPQYAQRLVGERTLPISGTNRWVTVEIVHVEDEAGNVIACVNTQAA